MDKIGDFNLDLDLPSLLKAKTSSGFDYVKNYKNVLGFGRSDQYSQMLFQGFERTLEKMGHLNLDLDTISQLSKISSVFHFVEGHKYVTKIGKSGQTTALSILRSVDPGRLNNNWLLRFDNPHRRANFPHLNIRHKYTGFKDPHLKLPPGSLAVAKAAGYTSKFLYILGKFSLLFDALRMGVAIKKDYDAGTMDNSIVCFTDILFRSLGAFVGATVGGFVGTITMNVIVCFIFSFIGGFVGAHYGGVLATKLTNALKKDDIYYPLVGDYYRLCAYYAHQQSQRFL